MLCHFFVPHISPEGTTGPNWLKFGMGPLMGITRGFIEGFLEIRSGGPNMGYPRKPRRGQKILKKFFSNFFILFCRNGSGKVWITPKKENLRLDMKFLRVCEFLKETGLSKLLYEAYFSSPLDVKMVKWGTYFRIYEWIKALRTHSRWNK